MMTTIDKRLPSEKEKERGRSILFWCDLLDNKQNSIETSFCHPLQYGVSMKCHWMGLEEKKYKYILSTNL
jgi:hypothetical protein